MTAGFGHDVLHSETIKNWTTEWIRKENEDALLNFTFNGTLSVLTVYRKEDVMLGS